MSDNRLCVLRSCSTKTRFLLFLFRPVSRLALFFFQKWHEPLVTLPVQHILGNHHEEGSPCHAGRIEAHWYFVLVRPEDRVEQSFSWNSGGFLVPWPVSWAAGSHRSMWILMTTQHNILCRTLRKPSSGLAPSRAMITIFGQLKLGLMDQAYLKVQPGTSMLACARLAQRHCPSLLRH